MEKRTKRVGRELFGKYLHVGISALRSKKSADAFQEWLRTHHLRPKVVNQLEDGCWHSIKQQDLFALLNTAHDHGVRPFFRVVDSGLWTTFRQNQKSELLAAPDEHGVSFPNDHDVIATLASYGILGVSFQLVLPTTSPQSIADKMPVKDILIIGSAKRNAAADAALVALFGLAAPTFVYPELANVTATTAIEEKGRPRTLRVGSRELREEHSRRVGIVVACRHSASASDKDNGDTPKEATTIIVAGCSRVSTREILEQLWQPELYRHVPDMNDPRHAGKPWLLIYDSARKRGHWELHGVARTGRKRGRPEKGDQALATA